MRYRVEMVCFVEVPDNVRDQELHAFDLAYEMLADDEPNEIWTCTAPLDESITEVK